MSIVLRVLRSFWLKAIKEFVFWFALLPGVFLAVLDEPLHTLGLLYLLGILLPLLVLSLVKAYLAWRSASKEDEPQSV